MLLFIVPGTTGLTLTTKGVVIIILFSDSQYALITPEYAMSFLNLQIHFRPHLDHSYPE